MKCYNKRSRDCGRVERQDAGKQRLKGVGWFGIIVNMRDEVCESQVNIM